MWHIALKRWFADATQVLNRGRKLLRGRDVGLKKRVRDFETNNISRRYREMQMRLTSKHKHKV